MSLLVKASRSGRDIVSVTPQSAGWKYVGFAAHRLATGESMSMATGRSEICVVVLRGTVTVATPARTWRDIGRRTSVFDDEAPYAVYVPADQDVKITAHSEAEIGVASAPGSKARPRRVRPVKHSA